MGSLGVIDMNLNNKKAKLEKISQSILNREVDIEIAKNCMNPVPGEGNPNAKLMFIGEAPGAREDKQGRPFVGASGRFLDQMLESIGLERNDVYITNIVKFRPPENRDPNTEEIEACLPWLVDQINAIKPALIVMLGRHSTNLFFPGIKIGDAHGREIEAVLEIGNRQLSVNHFLPLYHPAAGLYNGSKRKILFEDFSRIPKILEIIK